MEAIKHIVKIPRDHELRIKIPQHIAEDEIAEVILILRKKTDDFKRKVSEVKEAMTDTLFLEDLNEVSDRFTGVDRKGWENDNDV